jgi:MYXO-CTERM domain-containing protein
VTFAPSSSTVLQQVVTTGIGSAGYGFVMTVTPTTISAGVGVSTALSVTITDLNGFNEPVQLACAGVPYETSCTFAQATIPAGGGTTALIVSPTPPRPCSAVAMGGEGSRGGVPLLAMFGVAAWFARRRRRMLQGIALAFALCLLPMLNGCSSGCADFGTQPGNYSFTITGNAVGTAVPVTTTPAGSAALTQTQTIIMKIVP